MQIKIAMLVDNKYQALFSLYFTELDFKNPINKLSCGCTCIEGLFVIPLPPEAGEESD